MRVTPLPRSLLMTPLCLKNLKLAVRPALPSLVAGALLCLALPDAHADIYRWTDASGKVHFTDKPVEGARSVNPRKPVVIRNESSPSRHGASPGISINHKYYDVTPTSTRNMLATLLQASPIVSNGKKFIGYTNWWVDWKYTTRNESGMCTVATVDTRVTITYTMPRLKDSIAIPPVVREKFTTFHSRLMTHEEGHADHGIFAAREIDKALISLPRQGNCTALLPLARQTADAIIEKYKQKDKDYDRLTGHGRTQGAVL